MKKMLMPRQTRKTLDELDEKGFASIVIALILIIVLALFTVGFAQLARREQRSALDKQLATQAYYAAESGVNDTVKKLDQLKANPPDPDTCLGSPVTVGPAENGVQYACVLVNVKPPGIKWGNVQPESQRYITSSATSASGAGAGSITVNWGSHDGHNDFPDNMSGGFTPAQEWNNANYPGVIQFSLTPLNDLSRAGLMNNTFNVYLYPVANGGGSVGYTTGGNGGVMAANCNATNNGAQYPCKVTITGVTGGTGKYLFRVVVHYDASDILINGTDSLGQPVGFDGQVSIDVTGKAHEVLRRIQVYKAVKPSFPIPKDALTSQSTCKHFSTDPVNDTQTVTLPQDTSGACALN